MIQPAIEMPPGKILIVTSCTKNKAFPSGFPNHCQIQADQLWDKHDDDRTARNFGEVERYRIPAVQLYQGLQHTELMRGVKLFRQSFGPDSIDVHIISAGFGVVSEHQLLPPYEATFANQSPSKIRMLSQRLRIPQTLNDLLRFPYCCAFFLLGENYLSSLDLPFGSEPTFPCFFLASPASRKEIPRRTPYHLIPIGKADATAFCYNLVGLKGHLFKLFAEQMVAPQQLVSSMSPGEDLSPCQRFKRFLATPTTEQFLSILHPFRRPDTTPDAPPSSQIFQMPLFVSPQDQRKQAKNYGRPMRYFIPDWDDRVDPAYDFERDTHNPEKRNYDDEVYAHQIYNPANYDGLLFSKSTVEDGKAKKTQVREIGIHAFARFNNAIMGDCGAFSYIEAENPPYQTQEILDYYQDLGFDYGVSIDHLIVPAFDAVKEHRYNLTRENARLFLKLHRAGNYTFTPIGVAQGWSPETYKQAVIELLEWGYQYIALGGLARTQTKEIYTILEAIAPVLQPDTDLHLFGVARDKSGKEMQHLREYGITSFDSASYLRRAWLSATTNYFTEDGKNYVALRISPVYPSHARVKRIIAEGAATFEQLQKLEQDALKAVRAYGRRDLNIETTLAVLLEIDKVEEYNYEQHKEAYRKVLDDRPWEQCPCAICRDLGIEVIIFRGNDRNRRRGFHNTYVFYKRFRELIERS